MTPTWQVPGRRSILITGGFLLSLTGLLFTLLIPVVQRNQLQTALSRSVRMYRVGYASHIDLQTFTGFEWDQLYIFPPYMPLDSIDESLGFSWSRSIQTSIPSNDEINLLVFLNEDRVVRWIEVPRNTADFAQIAAESPFTPQNARFFLPDERSPVLGILR